MSPLKVPNILCCNGQKVKRAWDARLTEGTTAANKHITVSNLFLSNAKGVGRDWKLD